MANSDKNIRIQPNRNSTLFPKITFTGQSNNPITLNVLDDNSISFEGSAGQLFSINNNLSSGYIFSVNDISGLPSFRINADGTVGIAEFYGNVGIGITNPSYKFHARGDSYFSSTGNTALLLLSGAGGTIIASNSVNITLTAPARKGLVISAATSQSANLLEWYADGGAGSGFALAGTVRPTGQVHLGHPGSLIMSNGGSALLGLQGRGSSEGLAIRGYNSNSTNPLFEVQGNPGDQLFGIYGDGGVNAPRINVTNGTASTSTTSGALIVTGGVGIGGSVNIGSALTVYGTTRLNSSLFNIPPTSSIGGTSGSASFGSYWTGYQVENGYLIYGRQVVGGSILLVEPSTGTQVGGTSNIFAEALKHFKWGKDKYVVLASTGNSVLYSTSPVGAGSSWYYATLPTTASWQRLEYGNNRFVAIATGSTAAYSYDGITWSLSSLPASIAWTDIKYGNGVFVAGAASTVAYSYDGIEWTIASNNVPAQNLTYGNGFFFANNTGNTASYSADGINWTNVTLPSDTHRGSTYGNGVFFNIGASSSNYISSDLINWTSTANGVGSLSVPNSPWYVNNTFYWNNNASSFGAFVTGPSGTLDLNPRFTGDINNVEIGNVKPAAAEFTTLAASGPVRFVSGLASTNFRNGSVVITGGVGIGGTLNVNNIGIGYTGIPYNPSIAFIGTTGDPIRLNVLSNNTLSFEGRSGQLFSINNNLSSGWIFSVNDISGIPLFRANADATISMAEYAGNVGIGLSNPTFKFQVNGSASIGATLNVNRLRVTSKITFEPGTGTSAVSGWTGIGLTSLSRMIYGGGRFIGVGGSYVAYSTDGVNFTYTTIPGSSSTDTYGDIAYGNGVYVAVNAQNVGFTAYSYDGASWGRTSIATGIHRTVGFGNGRFLTIAEAGGNAYISTDGRNWSTGGAPGGYGREITFDNGYFLSPRTNDLYYSIDGTSWKIASTPNRNMIFAVTYGKGLYLAADFNTAQYYTSTDLVTWTQRSIDNRVWTGASYVNGVFYLIPNNNNFLHHSLDGINWSTTNFGTPIGGTNKMFTANDRLYFFSTYGPTLWSTDATTGTLMAKPFYNGEIENTRIGAVNPDSATFTNLTALNPVTFTSATASTGTDNGALTVKGGVGIGGTTNLNTLRINQDLVFTPTTGTTALASGLSTATLPSIPGAPGNIRIRAVTFGNGRFVGGASTSIIWSDDAINWNRVNTPFTSGTAIQAIAYGNGTWIASTSTGTELIYSLNNGVTWNLTTIPYANVTHAIYGNGLFIISSGQYSGISTNGINWSTNSIVAYPDRFINGYFYSSAYRSPDGINWQALNIPTSSAISYGNGMYFGAEYNSANYYYSYDGVNFATTTIGNRVHLNSAYFNGVYYLTTQHNNQVLRYSTDGFNYTDVVYPNGSTNYAIAYGNNKIVLFNTLYTDITNYIYYAEASFGKANIQPFREGTIDNVTIGSRIPQAGTFNNVSVLKNLNVNSNFQSVSSNTGALTVLGGVGIGASINIGGRIGIGTNLLTSTFNLLTPTSSTIGAFIQGRSSQTADFIDTANSSGIINFSVGANGNVLINLTSASSKGLIIKANASQSVNLLELQNSSASPLTTFDQLGNLNISSTTASGSTTTGALVVAGGVGIGGTLNAGSVNIVRDFNHTPNITTIGGASGWVASTASTFINPSTFRYLNDKYIGIGGTYVYYSDDMINWSSVMVPNLDPARPIANITYGEGKYVFVQYYTANAGFSTNLTNWTNVAIVYQTWNDVIYGNGRFLATTGGDIAAHSLDGTSWTSVTDSRALGFNTGLKFINGYFYVTNANAISRSIDGITWQVCNTPALPYGLAYGNGLYVGGVYNSGTIVYSYDGLNFSSYSGSSLVHNNSWFYNGVYYLTTNNNQVIRYSTDGFNWTNSTGFPSAVNNLQYIKGKLYVGSGNTVWVTDATPGRFEVNPLRTGTLDDVEIGRLSPNNANFIDVSVNNNLNVSSQYDSASYLDGALTVAGGVGIGKTLNTNSARVLNNFNHTPSTGSTGGIAWTSVAFPSIPGLANNGFDNSVIYGRDKFIGIGGTNVFYSYDSYNWFYAPLASATAPRSITYGNDMYIAINNTGNAAYYSYNGINWSTTTLANSTVNGDKACFGNGRFVYNDISGNVGISTNGINWSVRLVLSGGAYPYGVDYANGWFFARWQNNYFRSADLINWNRFSLPADSGRSKIFFSKNKYYAPNNNASTYFVSDDGFNWTTQTVANAYWINMYDYFGTLYLIRSSANAVSYSEDGINWASASLGGTSNTNATGLVYGNGRFVYVGSSPNLIFSGNAPNGVSHINTPRTSELDNVRIGAISPASAQVTGLNALGSVNFSSTTNSTSPFSGALTVAGGVGIGGTLTANDVNVVSRLTSFASFGSTGGLNWSSATVPANYTEVFNSVVYGNGKFAAVGATAVLVSSDAINWEVKNISWPVVPNGAGIRFLNSKFIVVAGNTSYIAYSDDAVTWQTANTPFNSGNLVYNGGRYYKYSGSTVGISTNLTNWTTQTTNGSAYRVLNGYFYNNSARSIDGINFESLIFPGTTPTDINYGNGIYFGAVYNSSIYYTSTDGLNFTQSTIEHNVYLGAEYYNGVYYLRCQHNIPKLYYSLDGYNYSSVNLFSNQYNLSMAFGNNKIVYIGYNPGQVNFLAYADATTGVVDLNTKFEGSIDNVVIGRKNARSASFLDVGISGKIVSNNTASSSTLSNNSAVFAGGVGIGGTLTVVGSVNVSNSLNLVNSTTGIAAAWTRTVVGTAATISYLAYANNLYVGVGYSSLTSTDGVNWTTRTLPHNLSFVSYGNGIWSGLLGSSALGATSTNGTSWTSYAMTNSRAWRNIVYGNGIFVTLAGGSNIAAYSLNGYNWTEVTMPTSQVWQWVAFGGGYFVAVANASATAVYSTDGINWNITTLPSASGWNCITYGNGYFYVTGSSTAGVYSKDLINWTAYTHNVTSTALAAYNNGTFVVVDVNGAFNSSIITGDFTSRTQIPLPGPQIPTTIVAGDRNFIAGYGQTFYTYPIPNNSITLSPNTTGKINNVEIGGIKPASGDFTNLSSTGSANLVGTVNANNLNILSKINQTPVLGGFAGTDGWTSPVLIASDNNYALAFGNGLFVQIRKTTNSINFSSDGRRWTGSTMPFTGDWNGVTWGIDKFVAVSGTGTTGAFSRNGISWTSMNMPSTAQGWIAVTYGDDKFVAVGNTSTSAYSSDGITWTGSSIANTTWTAVAYGNGTFVAVAGWGRSAAYSHDGIAWNLVNLPTNQSFSIDKKITYGNGYFVVTTYNTLGYDYSRDGVNWSTVGVSGLNRPITYGNGIYSVLNYSNAYYAQDITSTTNWLTSNTINSTDWIAFAYGNNRFVATSYNTGAVAQIDGPSNTLNLHPKFTGDIDNVRIGAKQPAAAEFTNLAAQQPVRFTANTPSTNTTNGALVVLGGVGIGGSLNIGSDVTINSRRESNSSLSGSLVVRGGVGVTGNLNVGGSVNFSSSIFGGVSTSIVPTMTFIGQANDPITLSVLSDNSLSFDGSSGQLFSINNNLSTGWIFSISDISGLPLFRTNADGTVSMGEFGGNVGIGLTNPTYKLQVVGNAGIANTLFVSGRANIGNTSFTDLYGSSYNPIITATDTFDDDIVIQIENKSDGVNARAGLLFKNNTNNVAQLYLSGGNYGGAGLGLSEIKLLGDYPFAIETKDTTIRSNGDNVANFGQTKMTVIPATESTSSSTGSLIVSGGAGIAKSVNIGGFLSSKPAYVKSGLASDQTLTAGSDNLILFTKVAPDTDPNTWWINSAGVGVSHIFKPNIAGLYFVSCQVHFKTGSGSGQLNIQARKNGTAFSLSQDVLNTVEGRTLNLSGVVQLNGSTDYVDFSAYTNSSGTPLLTGEGNRQYSQAVIYKIF